MLIDSLFNRPNLSQLGQSRYSSKAVSARRTARRPVTVALSLACVAALGLTGCAAGQEALTSHMISGADGVSADQGTIGIRAAAIGPAASGSYAAGSSAPLQVVLVNNGTAADSLTSVSSAAAGAVQLSTGGAGTATGASTNSSSDSSASSSSSANPSASDSSAPSPSRPTSTPIPVPPGTSVQVGFTPGGPSAILTGLTAQLYPAQTIPVTFTFASGVQIDVKLSVLAPVITTGPTLSVAPAEGK